MIKIHQVLKFLADTNPQKTPAKLSLFNFLKHFASPDEDLTPEWINLFFSYTMDYPHWESNKVQIGKEVASLIESLNKSFAHPFDSSQIKYPQNMQIIEINGFSDFTESLDLYLKSELKEGEKYRIVADQNKKLVAIVLGADGSLKIRSFDRKFTIREGRFEPLRTDLTLHYTADLELQENVIQKLEVAPYITGQFIVQKGTATGALIRGYVFQKFHEMKNEPIQDQPKLFYPLKRIEQFFVDRRTDPYYNELVTSLEKVTLQLQNKHPEAAKWAQLVANKTENALEHIFTGDKMLHLLLRDLRHTLENPKAVGPLSTQDLHSAKLVGKLGRLQFVDEKMEGEACLPISPL